jgi:predicted alpha/beta-fold hydrolase
MPIVKTSYPGPPPFLINGHFETVHAAVSRKFDEMGYQRERFTLSDGDFVDLDWLKGENRQLALLLHGLEGNSNRPYIKGMARYFHQREWDVLAWHCRSCSGEMNRKPRLYYHGETGDLSEVIAHILRAGHYQNVVLIGFSMGGSILLKYLGYQKNIPEEIRAGIAISTPVDLGSSAARLDRFWNRYYKKRFLRSLSGKIRKKAEQFPGLINVQKLDEVKTWKDFDDYFSAPINGFKSADELYFSGSALNYLEGIDRPALLINAQNDPILDKKSFPHSLCADHPFVHFEATRRGGHVGYAWQRDRENWWTEFRTWEFVQQWL